MTHKGRQILFRVSIWCARECGEALARQNMQIPPPDALAPFELVSWAGALQIVDDLFCGRVMNLQIPTRG
jgi:hypothetical protein